MYVFNNRYQRSDKYPLPLEIVPFSASYSYNAKLIEYAIEKMPYSYDSETNRLKLNVEK